MKRLNLRNTTAFLVILSTLVNSGGWVLGQSAGNSNLRRVTEERLVRLGACFYELKPSTEFSGEVVLYNSDQKQIARIHLTKTMEGSLTRKHYEFSSSYGQAWASFETDMSNGIYQSSVKTSANTMLELIATAPAIGKVATRLDNVRISNGRDWLNLSDPSFTSSRILAEANNFEQNLFAGLPLSFLGEVVRFLSFLSKQTLAQNISLRKNVTLKDELATMECVATCYMLALPNLYWCDGGLAEGCSCPKGSGFFTINGGPGVSCGILMCDVNCSAFDGIIT